MFECACLTTSEVVSMSVVCRLMRRNRSTVMDLNLWVSKGYFGTMHTSFTLFPRSQSTSTEVLAKMTPCPPVISHQVA